MTRTAAALVQGLLNFEPGLSFCGVVLNKLGSSRHEGVVRRALEEYTDLPVLGALPRLSENPLPERHMGIACRGEALAEDAERILDHLGELARRHVDLAAVLAAAGAAPPLSLEEAFRPAEAARAEAFAESSDLRPQALNWRSARQQPRRNCVAPPRQPDNPDRASAMCATRRSGFIIRKIWRPFPGAGAELIRLSLLDKAGGPWPELDGLYLGGGFPEDSAPELSRSPHLAELAGWQKRARRVCRMRRLHAPGPRH